MIVRWGIGELGPLLEELASRRPFLVTSARFGGLELPVATRFTGVRRHSPVDTVAEATRLAGGADCIVGLGGGSAIDTAKAVSASTGLPLVAVPTTYAGAEWTSYFGMRDEERGVKAGGSGALLAAVVYEPRLTLDLPVGETIGTALNALAHAAEALYGGPLEDASAGARLIGDSLPAVVADGRDLAARTTLLEGAMRAGRALGERGLFLGHAMAQALGGRYGLPHGAMNALCLPPALRFNEPVIPGAIAELARALRTDDAPARVEELARPAGFGRLRDHGVPRDDLEALAREVVARAGARANPRPASAPEVHGLLLAIW